MTNAMIDAWDKVAKLSTAYAQDMSATMQVAVLYAMLPTDLQEQVLDKCAGGSQRTRGRYHLWMVKNEATHIEKSSRKISPRSQ